jgi:hypothetical protein
VHVTKVRAAQVVVAILALARPAVGAEPVSLVPFPASTGAALAKSASEIQAGVSAALRKADVVQPSRPEVEAALGKVDRKTCASTPACLAAFARAAAVQYALVVRVDVEGGEWVFSGRLVDGKGVVAVAEATRVEIGASTVKELARVGADQLLTRLLGALARALAPVAVAPPVAEAVKPEPVVVEPKDPGPVAAAVAAPERSRAVEVALFSAGAALVATGAGLLFVGRGQTAGQLDPTTGALLAEGDLAIARGGMTLQRVGLGVGAAGLAAAVAGLVWWLLPRASPRLTWHVTPRADGLSIGVSLGFP